MSKQALRPTQPPIPGDLFPVVKQPGCDVDHSLLSTDEVRNEWSYTSIHLCPFIT